MLCWKTKIKGYERKKERERGYTGRPWWFYIEFVDPHHVEIPSPNRGLAPTWRSIRQRGVTFQSTRNLPPSTPDLPLSFKCLCHSQPRLPTTLLTTSKPARGKGNVRYRWKQIHLLLNVLHRRIPPKILRRISVINPRVLLLSRPNVHQYSRIPP